MSFERRLRRAFAQAVTDFSMLEEGDRVMVCVSGGKDSYTMLRLLRDLQARAPISFSIKVVNVDQGHPGYPADVLYEYMAREAYDFTMIEENTYAIVKDKVPEGKTYCSLCSRLRRGILYRAAKDLGCTKIALGHHREDALETLMLNLFFAGQLGSMPPKLVSQDGHIVIRPLAYAAEADVAAFAEEQKFPILPCDLCGSQEQLQRKVIKRMLAEVEKDHPGVKTVMLAALRNVRPSQLFDKGLWSALGLRAATESAEANATELQEGGAFIPLARVLSKVGGSFGEEHDA